jgi:dephospho-CoA kinase
MIALGLTGGIGMGKSTAADFFAKRGLPVVDTDVLAREAVEPSEPALEEIRVAFGAELIGPDGRLRRDELARAVFSDETKRKQLEAILHPRIRQRWLAEVEAWRKKAHVCGVVVIPLLFETGAERFFDKIICVGCSSFSQRERLRERGWAPDQIEKRLAAQWPIEKKLALSHFVIWTEGTLDVHAAQIDRVLKTLGVDHTSAVLL